MTEVLIMMYLVGWLCNLAGMAGATSQYYPLHHHAKERIVVSLAWPVLVPVYIVCQCINLYRHGGSK